MLAMGNSHEEIFGNSLRLLRFGVYFEKISNKKLLCSCRNNYINYSCTPMPGGSCRGICSFHEKILKL